MSGFRALSPERALEIIQAWINVSWPLSSAQAASIAAGLGWVADKKTPGVYISEMADGNDGDCIVSSENNFIYWINFPLSTLAEEGERRLSRPTIISLVSRIEESLIAQYGEPEKLEDSDGFKTDEWVLRSGASFYMGYDELVVDVSVSSPALTELMNDPTSDPNPDEEL